MQPRPDAPCSFEQERLSNIGSDFTAVSLVFSTTLSGDRQSGPPSPPSRSSSAPEPAVLHRLEFGRGVPISARGHDRGAAAAWPSSWKALRMHAVQETLRERFAAAMEAGASAAEINASFAPDGLASSEHGEPGLALLRRLLPMLQYHVHYAAAASSTTPGVDGVGAAPPALVGLELSIRTCAGEGGRVTWRAIAALQADGLPRYCADRERSSAADGGTADEGRRVAGSHSDAVERLWCEQMLHRISPPMKRSQSEAGAPPRKRPQRCVDGPALACAEPGCPAEIVSCPLLAELSGCPHRVSDIWKTPPSGLETTRVSEYCPWSCKRC